MNTSQLIASALRKLRPRPQSESDEDLCCDPLPPESESDVPIPSAQPHPPRLPDKPPPDCSNLQTTPPPNCDPDAPGSIDDDDVDVFNNSQELPVEGDGQRRLVQFRERWIETFSNDLSWDDLDLAYSDPTS